MNTPHHTVLKCHVFLELADDWRSNKGEFILNWLGVGGSKGNLGGDGLGLLGEGDFRSHRQMWSGSAEAQVVGLPIDDVDESVGSGELVGSPHDEDGSLVDDGHLTLSLLFDAVLSFEGIVEPALVVGAVVHLGDGGVSFGLLDNLDGLTVDDPGGGADDWHLSRADQEGTGSWLLNQVELRGGGGQAEGSEGGDKQFHF